MSAVAETPARTYEVKTHGCQMNVHDSERLSGLLEDAGYVRAGSDEQADVVVFNTCAVRENADNKLYGNLSHLAPIKAANPGMQIAVGGCLAQKDRSTITTRAPYVDVVFGTHNIGSLPVLLERARVAEEAQVEILESLSVFPSTLPTKRESAYAAWVSISVGCNNTCTFCIVPSLRGKEKDRRPGEILAEVEALVAEGVTEITLLGQNVNAYGVEFGDRQAFSKLLRACGSIEGLERVRFTSPHPAEFTDDVIEAMAETPNVMPSLHMPLQSGSDAVLRAMRRSYRQSKYLGIIERVRAAIPDAAITTDIIVGFPGETEEDFQATLDVVRAARFSAAFTFQYSKRPGTPAAILEDQVPPGGREGPLPAPRRGRRRDRVGREQGARRPHRRADGRRGRGPQGRWPRTASPVARRDNRLVHFAADFSLVDADSVRPGDMVDGRDHLRRPAPPRRRRCHPLAYAAPAPATPGSVVRPPRRPRPPSASACRRSACRRRCRPWPTPAADLRSRRAPRRPMRSPDIRGSHRQRGRSEPPGDSDPPRCLRSPRSPDAEGPDRRMAVGALGHASQPCVSGADGGTGGPPRTRRPRRRGTSGRPCGSCTGCARCRPAGTSHRS